MKSLCGRPESTFLRHQVAMPTDLNGGGNLDGFMYLTTRTCQICYPVEQDLVFLKEPTTNDPSDHESWRRERVVHNEFMWLSEAI